MSRVLIDRERCLGTGLCVVYAPGTFAHDEQTKAIVVNPLGDDGDAIRTAVDACPTGALRLLPDDADDEGA